MLYVIKKVHTFSIFCGLDKGKIRLKLAESEISGNGRRSTKKSILKIMIKYVILFSRSGFWSLIVLFLRLEMSIFGLRNSSQKYSFFLFPMTWQTPPTKILPTSHRLTTQKNLQRYSHQSSIADRQKMPNFRISGK